MIGAQWGDEGKGKITNLLSQKADYVVRYQGGDNAGHTVYIDENKFVFHLLPSGIIEKDKKCVLGNGVVINPETLIDEINILKERGIEVDHRLFISHNSHIILDYHKILDEHKEKSAKIGTTKRGIGPAYTDKYSRIGMRVVDYIDDDVFVDVLRKNLEEKKTIIETFSNIREVEKSIVEKREKIIDKIREFATDTVYLLNDAVDNNEKILFEGAQGSMLDIDFGTYPYVTSSNPTAGGVPIGTGVPPKKIDKILGIVKAYTTRVGEGPFPTEDNDEDGRLLRERGKEYGATTGRPRRCGWLDLVALKYSIMISGIDSLALTKLDVLDEFDEIKVSVSYKYKGEIINHFPYDRNIVKDIEPVYKVLKGWKQKTTDIKEFDKLPKEAKEYIRFIEKETKTPISIVSNGHSRASTLIRNDKYISF